MLYLHPALGLLSVLLFVWIGFRGLGARRRTADASAARATHRRIAPWSFALIGVTALGGTASVALLREDLDLAGSTHFYVGWTAVALGAALLLTSRSLNGGLRTAHPLLGLAAMAAAVLAALLGIRMLP